MSLDRVGERHIVQSLLEKVGGNEKQSNLYTLELYTCINSDFLLKLINSMQTEGCAIGTIMAKDVVKKLNERYDVHFGDVIVFNFDNYEEMVKIEDEWYENI